jgi:hypothetical protein
MNRDLERTLAESGWQRIRDHLANEEQRIREEIKNYPRPIPACDLQFNQLLEQRARISREWDRLHEASSESLACPDPMGCLQEFLRSSATLDEGAKRELTSFLKEGAPNSQ